MTVLEQKFMELLPRVVEEVAIQLKIANRLKALELKGRADLSITPEMVDEIVEG